MPSPAPRGLGPVYLAGLFSMGMIDLFVFLVPLYAKSLDFSNTEIGLLVGARAVFTMVFAIHAGSLMDRFGTRRVMLALIAAAVVLAPLYPLLPWFPALLALQLVAGAAVSLAWTGAQTLVAQIGHGEAEYIGRFSFAARIGTAAGPILGGMAWDLGGAWPAFALATGWGAALFAIAWLAPEPEGTARPRGAPPAPFRLRDLAPRPGDYARSFAMLAIPAVAITVAVIFVRNSTSGIQNSVYLVYLTEIGFTGTLIGVLFAAIEIMSGLGSLLGGRAMRLGDPQWMMVIATTGAIALICATPLLGGVFALLLLAQAVRGGLQGVIQPVMFSVQAKSVGRDRQGAVVGLRQTMNRLAAIIVPPLVGAIADIWGLGESFLILGAVLLAACAGLALIVRRAPRFAA